MCSAGQQAHREVLVIPCTGNQSLEFPLATTGKSAIHSKPCSDILGKKELKQIL